MDIFELTEVTEEIFQAFTRLIPQLTRSSPIPSREMLKTMTDSQAAFIFLARHPIPEGLILGSATLATMQTPTGLHGWIEDVVVDRTARRLGIGKALVEQCLKKGREIGLREVNLTSRPSREAANQLYQALGFTRRETNVYRLLLEE